MQDVKMFVKHTLDTKDSAFHYVGICFPDRGLFNVYLPLLIIMSKKPG